MSAAGQPCRWPVVALAVLGCQVHLAGAASLSEGLSRCAVITASDARLACYDALAQRPAGASSAAPTPAAAPVASAQASALAASAQASTVPAAAPVGDAALAAAARDPKNFGLSAVQQHVADLGPKSIAARIDTIHTDPVGRTSVVLDSGQTWTLVEGDDGRLSSGDSVTIKRASLGSFLLTSPSNHTYRVRRVK